MNSILTAFWFLLPAAVANMAPVIFARVRFLAYPVDGGLRLGDQPFFGANKTWRGIVFGVLAATLVIWIQGRVAPWPVGYTFIDYGAISVWCFGLTFGLGALGGDLVKSFFKRRLNIASGKPFPVFDQIDWVLGALIAASFVIRIPVGIWVTSLIMFGILHVVVNLISYQLGVRSEQW